MERLYTIIANAIKKADTRYFFEDYTRQSIAVLKTLDRAGFVIVPKTPTPMMMMKGAETMQFGYTTTRELIDALYTAMIEARPED